MIEKILENLAGQYGAIGAIAVYLLYNDYIEKKHNREIRDKKIDRIENKFDSLDEKLDKHILEHHSKKED